MRGSEVSTSVVKWSEMKYSEVKWSGAVENLNGVKPNERVVKCSWVRCCEVKRRS